MKHYLNKLPKELLNLIHLTSNIASKDNTPVYLVGGFVRDLLLGVDNLDLDIVVEDDGIKFSENFSRELNYSFAYKDKIKLIRHRRFGTATIIISSNLKIDIASARSEFYPEPASLPLVKRGSLKDDLARRDFTINAMAISINGQDFGRLIDFFGGRTDLVNKKIRILHPLSFIDDPTRILRAIRFEKRYNFRMEAKTLAYLKEAARLGMLEKVQPQRLRDEFILTLKEEYPSKQIKRLQELTGFRFINPNLSITKNNYRLFKDIERQIYWFKKVYHQRRQLDIWLIYFMGLMDSLNISHVKRVIKRFVFTKGDERRLLIYKKVGPKIILGLSQDKIKPSRIFQLLEPLSYEVILLLRARSRDPSIKKHIDDFFEIYNDMRLHISGDDLYRLGIIPGPDYQKIFTKVLNAKLNGKLKTKEEELLLIKGLRNIK